MGFLAIAYGPTPGALAVAQGDEIDSPGVNRTFIRAGAAPESPGWRILPAGFDQTAATLAHAPDLVRSDPDFAGIMLRCGTAGIEIILVVVTPYPPASRPHVTFGAEAGFDAATIGYGTAVRLPPEAATLARQTWDGLPELSIVISFADTRIRGIVPLAGVKATTSALPDQCRL